MEHWPFDQDALRNIHALSRNPSVRFVISSDWRHGRTVKQLGELFALKGMNIRVIDVTRGTNSRHDSRGQQITDWLIANGDKVNKFVILDDNSFDLLRLFPNNTVITRPDTGFSETDLIKTKQILGLK